MVTVDAGFILLFIPHPYAYFYHQLGAKFLRFTGKLSVFNTV
jgi:hypothetical protein